MAGLKLKTVPERGFRSVTNYAAGASSSFFKLLIMVTGTGPELR